MFPPGTAILGHTRAEGKGGDVNPTNLADEHAIETLLARYADAVNRRDAEAWAALWTADGVWKAFGQAFEGRDVVVGTWKAAMQGFRFVFHVVHSGVIELDGDTAHGRWSISEQLQSVSGAPGMLLALYHDDYRREGEDWRFASRELQVLYQGPPDLSGEPA
jgi:ketosteroid isomerase-like protein